MRTVTKYLLLVALLLAAVACLSLISGDVAADTHTWEGGGGNALTSTAGNWVGDVAPVANDDLAWTSGAVACTYDLNFQVNSITINGYTGVITQSSSYDINIGGGGYAQATGTLTPSTTRMINDAGGFVKTGGTLTADTARINLTGADKTLSVNTAQTIKLLEIGSHIIYTGSTIAISTSLTIDAGGNLEIQSPTVMDYRAYSGMTYTNLGSITGDGKLRIMIYDADKSFVLGTLNVNIDMTLHYGAAASHKFTLAGDTTFGKVFRLVDENATYTLTLDLAGYNLQVSDISVLARTILLGGEGIITCSGNLDTSLGTFTPESSRILSTGTGKTIKMASGQTLYDWTVQADASITLQSNIHITHNYRPYGTVDLNGYTLTRDLHWAPSFTSSYQTAIGASHLYTYAVTCNETVTYTIETIPAWLSWTTDTLSGTSPPGNHVYSVKITATSKLGGDSASQEYQITVTGWAPSFTNSPNLTKDIAEIYTYAPSCNESVTYTVVTLPDWLSWSSNAFTGTTEVLGYYPISVRADSVLGGLSSWKNGTIWVQIYGGIPPEFYGFPIRGVDEGELYLVTVIANEPVTWDFESDAPFLSFDGSRIVGQPNYSESGVYYVHLGVSNENGQYWKNYSLIVNDMTLPRGEITIEPSDGLIFRLGNIDVEWMTTYQGTGLQVGPSTMTFSRENAYYGLGLSSAQDFVLQLNGWDPDMSSRHVLSFQVMSGSGVLTITLTDLDYRGQLSLALNGSVIESKGLLQNGTIVFTIPITEGQFLDILTEHSESSSDDGGNIIIPILKEVTSRGGLVLVLISTIALSLIVAVVATRPTKKRRR